MLNTFKSHETPVRKRSVDGSEKTKHSFLGTFTGILDDMRIDDDKHIPDDPHFAHTQIKMFKKFLLVLLYFDLINAQQQ